MNKGRVKTAWVEKMALDALEILHTNDNEMSLAALMKAVEEKSHANIPEDRKGRYDNGLIKWQANVQFYCHRFVRSGFLNKRRGTWYLTHEGQKMLSKGKSAVIEQMKKSLKKGDTLEVDHSNQSPLSDLNIGKDDRDTGEPPQAVEYYQSLANEQIKRYIISLKWHKLEELCAALLRGMGYYVVPNDSGGPDGGIDVIAYIDPLGGKLPRVKLQAKHQEKKVAVSKIKELADSIKDGEIGILVSSSGFSKEAIQHARNHAKHLEMIDLKRFVELWQDHYDKMLEEDKELLPMKKIFFLGKDEEDTE